LPEIVSGTGPGSERTKLILIVEDEELVRKFIGRVLTDAGYDTVSASNAGEALEILKSLVVDLVVADIRMPGMDGLELGARISKLPVPPPVVYASASDQPPSDERHHYLQKPFTGSQLIQTIESILS
jgi:two-component system response regulator AlgR